MGSDDGRKPDVGDVNVNTETLCPGDGLRVCLLLARIKKYIALFEILQVIRKSLFGAFSQVSAVAMWQLLLSQLAEITQKSIFMLT